MYYVRLNDESKRLFLVIWKILYFHTDPLTEGLHVSLYDWAHTTRYAAIFFTQPPTPNKYVRTAAEKNFLCSPQEIAICSVAC